MTMMMMMIITTAANTYIVPGTVLSVMHGLTNKNYNNILIILINNNYNSYNNLMRWVLLLSPFYRRKN